MAKVILPICLISLLVWAGTWFMRGSSAGCADCFGLPALSTLTASMTPLSLPYPVPPEPSTWKTLPAADRLTDLEQRVQPTLKQELQKVGLKLGAPAYLRAFKESRELELWLQAADQSWQLFRSYPIAAASGQLGPKLKEGDRQVPEGFYAITPKQLNPASSYHLAMNIGYPNAYDLHHGCTGSFIMIHGSNVSIGCLAMTDPCIEEIYLIIQAALSEGQSTVPTHVFPFRMSPERLQAATKDPHHPFWKTLQPAYHIFEDKRQVPKVKIVAGEYQVR
ncbi:MAG: murein L,D-transpeptidase [Verrucomicrobia bacterium]|nr:murein L,D-transpeptidase [Verrucomicrobiota bacterium]